MLGHVYIVFRRKLFSLPEVIGVYAEDDQAVDAALGDAREHYAVPSRWVVERRALGRSGDGERIWEANITLSPSGHFAPALVHGRIGGQPHCDPLPPS